MTTPNGLAGCLFVLGYRQPQAANRFINDPVIIDKTMTRGVD
jgi:hypothetical protein